MIKFADRRVSFTRNKLCWGIVIACVIAMLMVIIFGNSLFDPRELLSGPGVKIQPAGLFNGDYPAMVCGIFLVLVCGLLAVIRLDLTDKGNARMAAAVMILMPVLMFSITEILNNNSLFMKSPAVVLLNYACYLLIYLLLFAAFNRFRLTMIIADLLIFAVAVFNHFKFLWRGEPVQMGDVVSLQTAVNVSGNYHVELSPVLVTAALLFSLSVLIVSKCRYGLPKKRSRLSLAALCVLGAAFLSLALADSGKQPDAMLNMKQDLGLVDTTSNQSSNFMKNGMIVALTINAQHIAVETPDEYSEEQVMQVKANIEDRIGYSILPNDVIDQFENDQSEHAEEGQRVLKDGEKPNIICIMNEAYSDMSSVGELETDIPLHPYMDELFRGDDIIHGDLNVSVHGGGTANSEFEFLTGNTMAFLPNGSIPYQQYIEKTTGALPRYLNGQGYHSVAVHPFLASGWNRPEVYKNMGFDDFISIDDFDGSSELIRSYISDKSSYDKLIEIYENKEEGQPLFLFNVTMQNHGSYDSPDPDLDQDVHLTDYPDEFPETEQYLSLTCQSDAAVQYLIDYFRTADEPVIICFFGDHLPNMCNGFYEAQMEKETFDLTDEELQRLYMTDFFIWANYDIPECEVRNISLNYLSTLLLQMTGLDLPEYNLLLSEVYEQYPVVTAVGIRDWNGTLYEDVDDVPDETGILNEYRILAYNNIFDTSVRHSELFDEAVFVPEKNETDTE